MRSLASHPHTHLTPCCERRCCCCFPACSRPVLNFLQGVTSKEHFDDLWGKHLYSYFNWRQGSSFDLLVTLGLFISFVVGASAVRRWAVDGAVERAAGNLWADIYQVRTREGHTPCTQTRRLGHKLWLPWCMHLSACRLLQASVTCIPHMLC